MLRTTLTGNIDTMELTIGIAANDLGAFSFQRTLLVVIRPGHTTDPWLYRIAQQTSI